MSQVFGISMTANDIRLNVVNWDLLSDIEVIYTDPNENRQSNDMTELLQDLKYKSIVKYLKNVSIDDISEYSYEEFISINELEDRAMLGYFTKSIQKPYYNHCLFIK